MSKSISDDRAGLRSGLRFSYGLDRTAVVRDGIPGIIDKIEAWVSKAGKQQIPFAMTFRVHGESKSETIRGWHFKNGERWGFLDADGRVVLSRCCTGRCLSPAISCLGASPTPAVGARDCRRHAGVRETFTEAVIPLADQCHQFHRLIHRCLSRAPSDPHSEAAPSPEADESAQPAHRGNGVRAPNPYRKPSRPPRPLPCPPREWPSWP